MTPAKRKPLHFVAGSLKDLRGMPEDVQDVFGSALLDAQYGDHPAGARPFGEGLPRAIMKLVEDFDGDTFRIGYTVSFPRPSTSSMCSRRSLPAVEQHPSRTRTYCVARLHLAEQHYRSHYGGE
jgi:hypothetical protein